MRFGRFSELLRNAGCLIGNSSAGVREAPFLGVASLDVGTRQTDRAFGPSITKLPASDRQGILRFIETNWHKRFTRGAEFGDGNATEHFITLLNSDAFWQRSMQKQFHDIAS